jgi:hypothetical protein
MSENNLRHNVPRHRALHPVVYRVMAGAAVWMVVVCWVVFGADSYTGLQLTVVVGFALTFLLIPYVLGRLSPAQRKQDKSSFHDWLGDEFETNTGDVRSRDAMVMVLVAPMAGAVGISAIGFVAWLAATGAL